MSTGRVVFLIFLLQAVAVGIVLKNINIDRLGDLFEKELPEGTRHEHDDGTMRYENWPLNSVLTELSEKAGLHYVHNPAITGSEYLVTAWLVGTDTAEGAEQAFRELAFNYAIEVFKREKHLYALTEDDLAAIPHEKFMWKIRYVAEEDVPSLIKKLEALQTEVESRIDYSKTRVLTIQGRGDEVRQVVRLLDLLDSETALEPKGGDASQERTEEPPRAEGAS